MRPSRWVLLPLVGLVGWAGCSDSSEPDARVMVAPSSPNNPDFLGGDQGAAGTSGTTAEQPACLGETQQAEAIPLDLFLMVDISASMLDTLPGATLLSRAQTKWDAVKLSLEAFVQAPESTDIGVGLQYFPQTRPGVPFQCFTPDECGAGGPCTASLCIGQYAGNSAQGPISFFGPVELDCVDEDCLCERDNECGGNGATCEVAVGVCTLAGMGVPTDPPAVCNGDDDCLGLPDTACEPVGRCIDPGGNVVGVCVPSIGCPPGAGDCVLIAPNCLNQTFCDPDVYADPAVPISSDAARGQAIVDSLEAVQPNGLTPTGPALQGALDQAREWALAHPERQVITVFATDGLPTECTPLEIPDIAAFARTANSGNDPVHTFVIGVFSQADLAENPQQRLDTIAQAGGSERAFIINATGNLADEFLAALNEIRDSAISCTFQLDAEAALDFDKVNFELVDGAGAVTLDNVSDLRGCGVDEQGWYYERDAGGTPTQIKTCPNTCRRLSAGGVTANLQIGCATRIR